MPARTTTPANKDLLTATQAADYVGVHRDTIYAWSRAEAIPTVRLGARKVRYSRTALDAWIAEGGTEHPCREVTR